MMVENKKTQEKILALLLMRFKVSPTESLKITQNWLSEHSGSSYDKLEGYLKNSLVRIENNQLIDLYDERIMTLVNDLRSDGGIEIKDRRYRLTSYPQCFVGNEVVKWIEAKYSLSKPEALRLGQELIDLKIIHHVADEHDFRDDYFFYRFYIDE